MMRSIRIACAAVAAACVPVAANAASLQLQATLQIQEQAVPGDTPVCALVGFVTGSGSAKSIGALGLSATDCINPLPPTFTSFGFVSTEVVLSTVKGDQLFASYAGVLGPNGALFGAYSINGGTGKFAHAKGVGTMTGFEMIDPTTGVGIGEITLNGKLTY